MSYIIKFNENKFIISGNNKILLLDYDKYYKELRDFIINNNYIEITMEKDMRYFFLTTKFGLKLYKSDYFTKIINTNEIELYDIAKIVYIFYINKIL